MDKLISFFKTIYFLLILINSVYSQSKCNQTIPFTQNDVNGIMLKNPYYTDNIHSCWFKVQVEQGYGLLLEFKDFNLQEKACFDSNNDEACCDYLQIGTGGQVGKQVYNTYCGARKLEPILIESNSVWFNFHTDESINLDGFRIKINKFKLYFNETSAQISSPDVPLKYANNLNLTYEIHTEENSLIFIRFERFSVESFNSTCVDYLEIGELSSNGSRLGSSRIFCGEELPEQYFLNSNRAYLKFYTDKSETYSGFSLFYKAIKHLYTEPSGVVEALQYSMNMTYKIRAPENKKIEIIIDSFEFLKCLSKNIELVIQEPHAACSLYNDHLSFINAKGSLDDLLYKEILGLYSSRN